MPTTMTRRSTKAARIPAHPKLTVPEMLLEFTYRLHTTRVMAKVTSTDPRKSR